MEQLYEKLFLKDWRKEALSRQAMKRNAEKVFFLSLSSSQFFIFVKYFLRQNKEDSFKLLSTAKNVIFDYNSSPRLRNFSPVDENRIG